ncbi:hypothetical protein Tco_0695148, partial [Tanacetum coccineum]
TVVCLLKLCAKKALPNTPFKSEHVPTSPSWIKNALLRLLVVRSAKLYSSISNNDLHKGDHQQTINQTQVSYRQRNRQLQSDAHLGYKSVYNNRKRSTIDERNRNLDHPPHAQPNGRFQTARDSAYTNTTMALWQKAVQRIHKSRAKER